MKSVNYIKRAYRLWLLELMIDILTTEKYLNYNISERVVWNTFYVLFYFGVLAPVRIFKRDVIKENIQRTIWTGVHVWKEKWLIKGAKKLYTRTQKILDVCRSILSAYTNGDATSR